jgi:hypothetical protein
MAEKPVKSTCKFRLNRAMSGAANAARFYIHMSNHMSHQFYFFTKNRFIELVTSALTGSGDDSYLSMVFVCLPESSPSGA